MCRVTGIIALAQNLPTDPSSAEDSARYLYSNFTDIQNRNYLTRTADEEYSTSCIMHWSTHYLCEMAIT